jgi:hypothetical protein
MLGGLDGWRWDNLALPAGVRFAPFSATVSSAKPVTAVATFGPRGLEGTLTPGPFEDVTDAVLRTHDGRSIALRLDGDGTFHAGQQDVLPKGQFLAGTVLSDRQQRRQELYREFLKFPAAEFASRDMLLAWAKPADMHFTVVRDARLAGSALLVVPLQMERAARAGPVNIPGPFVSRRRVVMKDRTIAVVREAGADTDMELRFQLPTLVLPLKVERARLLAKISAPGRRLVIPAPTDSDPVELYRAESPADAFHVDIADARLLRLGPGGSLHLNLSLRGAAQNAPKARDPKARDPKARDPKARDPKARDPKAFDPKAFDANSLNLNRPQNWKIEYLELEISGQRE